MPAASTCAPAATRCARAAAVACARSSSAARTPAACAGDLVCVSGGWSPNVHLASHLGHRPEYRARAGRVRARHAARGPRRRRRRHGGARGAGAAAGGWQAGTAAAGVGEATAPPRAPASAAIPGHLEEDAAPASPPRGRGKVFVDLQHDVTADDVELAWREGYRSPEHLKRYTTLGMGTDQGRTSNVHGLQLMAALTGRDVESTGTTTFRPPFTPVALGALAGRRTGAHFRPERRSPMHARHVAAGAAFTPAGPWLRPWYYRDHGADVGEACVREMEAVRGNVGMTDVSTLGKIDVQGPDAAELLNRVYVNAWLRLPVGRARYGVMLRDDGLVLDDGTTSRIAEHHYFMTTTTGQAGRVMAWLEYLLDTAWPDLRVRVTSVTDQWAAVAVAGPCSQAVLRTALAGVDLADATLAPMGVAEAVTDDGLPVRLLRVSFSGERAYEVYTPAGHGASLRTPSPPRARRTASPPMASRPWAPCASRRATRWRARSTGARRSTTSASVAWRARPSPSSATCCAGVARWWPATGAGWSGCGPNRRARHCAPGPCSTSATRRSRATASATSPRSPGARSCSATSRSRCSSAGASARATSSAPPRRCTASAPPRAWSPPCSSTPTGSASMPEARSPLAPRYAVGCHGGDAAPGLILREIVGRDLVQAACWRGRGEALHAAVAQVLGIAPPEAPCRWHAHGEVEVLSVAPDRLWCMAPLGDARLAALADALTPATGCVTQLGHSHVRLRLAGPAARRLLAQEIALDLDPGAFPAGRIARTPMHHVPVLLQCLEASGDGVFDLYLPHSYAASAWEYLLDLARAYGYTIEPAGAP
ncbi:MAG: sarcosine oxidase subunit gamma family protein [Halofilum sp. (in: g-proteobacteria)]|nr:sarcosine oxidase subunit gamma family protein [Halofilum sp. (in: g-proteobacteria)]